MKTSDSQCESQLRHQRQEVGILLSILALLFTIICWRMPALALALVGWVAVSFVAAGAYTGLRATYLWWYRRHH